MIGFDHMEAVIVITAKSGIIQSKLIRLAVRGAPYLRLQEACEQITGHLSSSSEQLCLL